MVDPGLGFDPLTTDPGSAQAGRVPGAGMPGAGMPGAGMPGAPGGRQPQQSPELTPELTEWEWQQLADYLGVDVTTAKQMYHRWAGEGRGIEVDIPGKPPQFIQGGISSDPATYHDRLQAILDQVKKGMTPQEAAAMGVNITQGPMAKQPTGRGGWDIHSLHVDPRIPQKEDRVSGGLKGWWDRQGSATSREWAGMMQGGLLGFAQSMLGNAMRAYNAATGQEMPPDLRQQVLAAANSLDDATKRAIMGGQITHTYIDDLVSSYISGHPGPKQKEAAEAKRHQQKRDSLRNVFNQALGRNPTEKEYEQLTDAADDQVKKYINGQPYRAGMTYGTYQTASDRLTPLWQKYFGRAPNDKELGWSIGRSDQDVQDWIYDQPSPHVHGITIGRYEATANFAKQLGQKMGIEDDKGLIDELAQA